MGDEKWLFDRIDELTGERDFLRQCCDWWKAEEQEWTPCDECGERGEHEADCETGATYLAMWKKAAQDWQERAEAAEASLRVVREAWDHSPPHWKSLESWSDHPGPAIRKN